MQLRQQRTHGGNILQTVSGLRPEMAIVRHPDVSRTKLQQVNASRTKWMKIGVAAAIGITFGIAASALSPSSWSPVPKATQVVVTRSPYIIPNDASAGSTSSAGASAVGSNVESGAVAVADTEEMERLKTRNRRLEALISVLRDRKQHSAN